MKPNDRHHWTIGLFGHSPKSYGEHHFHGTATGTIEDALQRADELEDEVDFEVTKFVIERGDKVSK